MLCRRLFSSILALAVLTAISSLAYGQLAAGKKAPNFTLKTLNNKNVNLADYFKKPAKVVVMDMWATWCPPCRAEIPFLIDLNKRYCSKGVAFLGVSLDTEKTDVANFVKENKINYTIVHDRDGDVVGPLYKVRSIPQTYILDRKGVIRYVHSGFGGKEEAQQIEKEIKTLLAEKK